MWKDYKILKRIPESIAGYNSAYPEFCYIRYNPVADPEKAIEFTMDRQPGQFYPPELYCNEDYLTSAGYIELVDNGEWGGYLAIGGKEVLSGNFNRFFICEGERFAVSSLCHMSLASFELARIYDDGTAEYIYHSNKKEKQRLKIKNGTVNIGFDGYCVQKKENGHEIAYILCSGTVWDVKLKDFIPKELNPNDKRRIREVTRSVKMTYQIAGEEIPSLVNEEYRCQVIQIYEIELESIKDANFIASVYQNLIKPLCVMRFYDSKEEEFSFADKRLSQTEENK